MRKGKLRKTDVTQDSRLKTQDFLLEIGCEELPADYLPAALDWEFPQFRGLGSQAAHLFFDKKVVWKEIQTYAGPRRLVLKVSGVEPRVEERVEGPPVSIAFDSQGHPTEAAAGFARKQKVPFSRLKRRSTSKGERLVVERSIPVEKVLAALIPELIHKVPFPKTMRWEASGARFARPIRWMLALYGSKPVKVAFGSVQSGRATRGTRRSGDRLISVSQAAAYFSTLKRSGITLERGRLLRRKSKTELEVVEGVTPKREALRKRLETAARRMGGRLGDSSTEEFNGLLTTVTFLAEDPRVEAGSFRKEYLSLPAEVLATAMAKHLKLFSLYGPDGKTLLPKFLAVLEGKPKKAPAVMAHIDRIIEVRFSDAKFFYQEDTKTPLEAKIPELEKVVFHEKLGTVGDRIPRLERLARAIARAVGLPSSQESLLLRAARLAKADLVTQMVREFPSLQGTLGGRYAAAAGEPPELAGAIAEHYRPRTAGDPVPVTGLGAVLSLADRMDALIGYFGAGLKPTGSLDPYGLRRQATGLVRILMEPPEKISFVGLSIDSLLEEGIQSGGFNFSVAPETLRKEIRAFLRERFEWLTFVKHRVDREPIAAVLAAGDDDLAGAWERLTILRGLWADSKQRPVLVKAAKVAERTGRIVKAAQGDGGSNRVNPEAFREDLEKRLWETWNRLSPLLSDQVQRRRFREAVETYSSLYPEVHEFFEKVFVMDENLEIRKNRLAFMSEIYRSLSGSFADLSKLPLAGIDPRESEDPRVRESLPSARPRDDV